MIRFIVSLAFLLSSYFLTAQQIAIGTKQSLYSSILKEDRSFSVYLPPSYYKNEHQKFPVIYILDGDYNFRYVTGLIELQSSISENIPEMIVVGISGKGSLEYRKNCKQNINVKDKGNADKVLLFIEKELFPYINSHYKSSGYNLLGGHSVGGIFVVNAALTKPNLFKHYIAISPALWWENKAMKTVASASKNPKNLSVYISLADEKGMEVLSFLKAATHSIFYNNITIYVIFILFIILATFLFIKNNTKIKKIGFSLLSICIGIVFSYYLMYHYYPTNNNFHFKKFADENHNSVGEPTYKWSLNSIFKSLKVDKQYFKNANELEQYLIQNKSVFNLNLPVPKGLLSNSVFYILNKNNAELLKMQQVISKYDVNQLPYFNSLLIQLYTKNKENDKAIQLIKSSLIQNPKSIDLLKESANYYKEQKDFDKANQNITKALELATQQHLRLWEINELIELKELVSR